MARALGTARLVSGSARQVSCMRIFRVLQRQDWARPEAGPVVVQVHSERPNRCFQKEARARTYRLPRIRSMAGAQKTAESRLRQMENMTSKPRTPYAIFKKKIKWTSMAASAQIHMTACS